jgi:predicted ribonuclease YlaK
VTSVDSEEYSGWGKYYPNDEELAMLYSDPKINILKCKTNEFAKIYVGNELKDVLFWTGTEYRKLNYKEFVAPTGERIVPRNIEQKMYLDLLQNDNVPIKLCIGRFGTGKSMFAETWATH